MGFDLQQLRASDWRSNFISFILQRTQLFLNVTDATVLKIAAWSVQEPKIRVNGSIDHTFCLPISSFTLVHVALKSKNCENPQYCEHGIYTCKGNKRADVHMRGRQFLSSDHIVEMIPPIWTLGKEFLTSTTFERKGDLFRIVGK